MSGACAASLFLAVFAFFLCFRYCFTLLGFFSDFFAIFAGGVLCFFCDCSLFFFAIVAGFFLRFAFFRTRTYVLAEERWSLR